MKVRSYSFSIIFILVAILNSMGNTEVNETNIKNFILPDCISTADFIEDHFLRFVNEYNKVVDDENMLLNATYIEDRKNVTNITDNTKAVYLDFNDDNGYAVIGNDYKMLDFATSGDLYYLKEKDNLLFSEYDGFVYETDYGYARYDFSYPEEDYWNEVSYGRFYNGQYQGKGQGSGFIINPEDYITDRYGYGYLAMIPMKLYGNSNVYQKDYNFYTSSDGSSEGNCTLSAMLGIMQYLRDYKSMNLIPRGMVKINPKNDSFYNSLKSQQFTDRENDVPKIYATIRQKEINYGYTHKSTPWTSINMANVYMDVMKEFGYTTNIYKRYARLELVWSFESHVKREIDAGFPIMWNTGRGQYGSHSMVVKGYQQFFKEYRIWFIKWRDYKNLMILNDNWRDPGAGDRYFDLDAYGRNLINEGFGTFLRVRNYTF